MAAKAPMIGPHQTADIFHQKWYHRLNALIDNRAWGGPTPRWCLAVFDLVIAFDTDYKETTRHVSDILPHVVRNVEEMRALVNCMVAIWIRNARHPKIVAQQKEINKLVDKVTLAEIEGTWKGISSDQEEVMDGYLRKLKAGKAEDGIDELRDIFLGGAPGMSGKKL